MRRNAWLAASVLALGGGGMGLAPQGEFAAIADIRSNARALDLRADLHHGAIRLLRKSGTP